MGWGYSERPVHTASLPFWSLLRLFGLSPYPFTDWQVLGPGTLGVLDFYTWGLEGALTSPSSRSRLQKDSPLVRGAAPHTAVASVSVQPWGGGRATLR